MRLEHFIPIKKHSLGGTTEGVDFAETTDCELITFWSPKRSAPNC